MSTSTSTPSAESPVEPVSVSAQLLRAFWKGAIIPVCLLVFFLAAPRWLDARLHSEVDATIRKTTGRTEAEKERGIAAFAALDFQKVCHSSDPAVQRLRTSFDQNGVAGQFRRLEWGGYLSIALVAIVLGVNGATLLLNRKAQASRDALISAYRLGWALTMIGSLSQVFLLIPLLAYGIFELTTLAADRFFPQLIAAIVIGGLIALWRSATILLRNPPLEFEESMARAVTADEAPALWESVRQAAAKLNTAPPDHILIGMQLNFYVTEFAVKHSSGRAEGRTLFLSQPLLKQLTSDEVLAIIGHELGHFIGEDTKITRVFYPLKMKAEGTFIALAQSGWVGWTSVHAMSFFHWCFGGTEQAMSRQRELEADRVGATLTSPATAARALVKFHVVAQAYNLGLTGEAGQRIENPLDAPLAPFIREHLVPKAAFWKELFEAKTHHPLDSHPALHVRLNSLAQPMGPEDAIAVATAEGTTAYAVWFEGKEALFTELNAKATEALTKFRAGQEIGQADYTTDAGRELLEQHFPEVRWKGRPFPVWLAIVFCGLFGALALIGGIVVADRVGTPALLGLAVLLGLGIWVVCRRYWRGELILRADGLQCTGWDRPLPFSEVAAISAVRNNGGVVVRFLLKQPAPPLWESSLPYRRKVVALTLSWWTGNQDETWQKIYRYFTRQVEG